MLPLPPIFSPTLLTARALNALLRREPWAADRLSRHAGKSLRFNVGSLRVSYTIEVSGLVRACDPAVRPDVSLSIGPEHLAELPAVLSSRDLSSITERLHVQGDAALATLVSELARDLRWDIEEDLAAVFGDLIGPGLLRSGRSAVGLVQSATERVGANLAEYLGEESQLLATRPGLRSLHDDCAAMLRRIEALERRVGRVSGDATGG